MDLQKFRNKETLWLLNSFSDRTIQFLDRRSITVFNFLALDNQEKIHEVSLQTNDFEIHNKLASIDYTNPLQIVNIFFKFIVDKYSIHKWELLFWKRQNLFDIAHFEDLDRENEITKLLLFDVFLLLTPLDRFYLKMHNNVSKMVLDNLMSEIIYFYINFKDLLNAEEIFTLYWFFHVNNYDYAVEEKNNNFFINSIDKEELADFLWNNYLLIKNKESLLNKLKEFSIEKFFDFVFYEDNINNVNDVFLNSDYLTRKILSLIPKNNEMQREYGHIQNWPGKKDSIIILESLYRNKEKPKTWHFIAEYLKSQFLTFEKLERNFERAFLGDFILEYNFYPKLTNYAKKQLSKEIIFYDNTTIIPNNMDLLVELIVKKESPKQISINKIESSVKEILSRYSSKKIIPGANSILNRCALSVFMLSSLHFKVRYFDCKLNGLKYQEEILRMFSILDPGIYSAIYFFDRFPFLKRELNLLDEYEVHNFIKKILNLEEFRALKRNIQITRMPHLRWKISSNLDEETYWKKLILETNLASNFGAFQKYIRATFGISFRQTKEKVGNLFGKNLEYFYESKATIFNLEEDLFEHEFYFKKDFLDIFLNAKNLKEKFCLLPEAKEKVIFDHGFKVVSILTKNKDDENLLNKKYTSFKKYFRYYVLESENINEQKKFLDWFMHNAQYRAYFVSKIANYEAESVYPNYYIKENKEIILTSIETRKNLHELDYISRWLEALLKRLFENDWAHTIHLDYLLEEMVKHNLKFENLDWKIQNIKFWEYYFKKSCEYNVLWIKKQTFISKFKVKEEAFGETIKSNNLKFVDKETLYKSLKKHWFLVLKESAGLKWASQVLETLKYQNKLALEDYVWRSLSSNCVLKYNSPYSEKEERLLAWFILKNFENETALDRLVNNICLKLANSALKELNLSLHEIEEFIATHVAYNLSKSPKEESNFYFWTKSSKRDKWMIVHRNMTMYNALNSKKDTLQYE